MNFSAALTQFRQHHSKLTTGDIPTIKQVVSELGLTDAEFMTTKDRISDTPDDIVHIHSTMIVARTAFTGAAHTDTYPTHPFQMQLTGWADRNQHRATSSAYQSRCACPDGQRIDSPKGSECVYCGETIT